MLKIEDKLPMSPYYELYDMLVPKDNKYRCFDELVDFTFVRDELIGKYCPDNGRNAIDPVILFKYLVIKMEEDLSDADLVERSMTDLSLKRFLGYMPEDRVIDSSTLTRFRRERLKDVELLNLLLSKTVAIAAARGILKSKTLIVDGTHTSTKYRILSPYEALCKRCKELVKRATELKPSAASAFPELEVPQKPKEAISYCKVFVEKVREQLVDIEAALPGVLDKQLNNLNETIDDIEDHFYTSEDRDARVGHKTRQDSFGGYKTIIGMLDERIVASAVILSGEQGEGRSLEEVVEQSRKNGAEVKRVIGDAAYSGKDNYALAEDNFELVSKQPALPQRMIEKFHEDGFEYNKDSDMIVCPAGHQAIEKKVTYPKNENGSQKTAFYFDKKICSVCKLKDTCIAVQRQDPRTIERGGTFREGSVKPRVEHSISDFRMERMKIEETEDFKQKYKQRYKIEAKNGELKNNHHFNETISKGYESMTLQTAVTFFVANLNRIVKIEQEKAK